MWVRSCKRDDLISCSRADQVERPVSRRPSPEPISHSCITRAIPGMTSSLLLWATRDEYRYCRFLYYYELSRVFYVYHAISSVTGSENVYCSMGRCEARLHRCGQKGTISCFRNREVQINTPSSLKPRRSRASHEAVKALTKHKLPRQSDVASAFVKSPCDRV